MNAKSHTVRNQKLLAGHAAVLIGSGKKADEDVFALKFVYIGEIRHRAEAMTPLLKEILEFRPRPQWKG